VDCGRGRGKYGACIQIACSYKDGEEKLYFVVETKGIQIISCGSSTGQIVHKERGKTYISYNLIKIGSNTVTCTLFVEDVLGAGAEDIKAPPPME